MMPVDRTGMRPETLTADVDIHYSCMEIVDATSSTQTQKLEVSNSDLISSTSTHPLNFLSSQNLKNAQNLKFSMFLSETMLRAAGAAGGADRQ